MEAKGFILNLKLLYFLKEAGREGSEKNLHSLRERTDISKKVIGIWYTICIKSHNSIGELNALMER
ncbi:MAG TPA: hypothetical protein GXX70_02565 [Tepidimicrobium sp.]|nr:hypothetical protein [Tepidimicrobium sp.]